MISIDYRQFSSEGVKPKEVNPKWWSIDGDGKSEKVADSIGVILQTLKENQNKLEAQRQASSRLYGNIPLYGSLGLNSAKGAQVVPVVRDRLTYNVVQSCVDTVTAKIAKNKPKPLFLTDGGNYKLQRKAKKLNQFVDGVFFDNEVHNSLGPIAFRDCCVLGDGILHVFDYYGQVKIERVLASEILVDEIEAIYGKPTQMHRVKNTDRLVLAEMFPKFKDKIMKVEESTLENRNIPHISDQVTVCESWHLPSSPEAGDGKHVIVMTGVTLYEEEWDKDFFPFAFLPWCKRLYGFWSQGGAEQIQNIQLEINKLLWVIQRSMHLMGSFKILVQNGSKVVSEHLNNDIGTIVNYAGQPPTYITPPIIQPELYAHLATLKQAAYEQFGISQLSASSRKPEGLDSGKALREYNDIESERFMIIGQQYEKFHLDLAKLIISTGRDIAKKHGKLVAKVPGARFLETIDWKDVDLKEDQYVMQVFPVSSLPQDPSGRLATIQEYAQAGYIDPRTARKLSDFPDLQQVESLANSVEERILKILDKIVDDGEYTPPDQYMDLAVAQQLAMQYYNQYSNQGLELERLDMITQFMTQLDQLNLAAMPPPQMGAPQANPMPTPQSDLIPNVPIQ
jgi:hypothetical protein